MRVTIKLLVLSLLLPGLLAVGLLSSCEVGSPNNVVAGANGDFSGNYVGASNGLMVADNSGAPVSSLTLNQTGNQLQAVDNNGIIFKGTIGDILSAGTSSNATATFTLTGATTAGATVTINGTLTGSGSTATMTGLWVEPDRYRSLYGVAGISPIVLSVSITPTSATLISNSMTQVFAALGGKAPYTWSLLNSNGTLSTSTGASVTYTRTAAGNNSVTVTDSASTTATAGISQP